MTDQPDDLPPALIERVQAIIEDIAPACVDCSAHVVSNRKSAMERFLRAVAPDLIAHGRELEKAKVVEWLWIEAIFGDGEWIFKFDVADAIDCNEHRSKP